MSPRDAARSLTDRVLIVAAQRQVDTARLRRQLVFQRILARRATDDVWVLKGG